MRFALNFLVLCPKFIFTTTTTEVKLKKVDLLNRAKYTMTYKIDHAFAVNGIYYKNQKNG